MFFFSSRRRHTRCALVTGVQTCALPILSPFGKKISSSATQKPLTFKERWTLHASHQNGVNCPWNGAEKWKSLSSPFGLNSHSHPAPFSPGGKVRYGAAPFRLTRGWLPINAEYQGSRSPRKSRHPQ